MPTPKKAAPAKASPVRTVRGVPIPEGDTHTPFALTDQAIAERNQRPGRVNEIARITRDEDFDQKLDELNNELELGTDPFRELAEKAKQVNPDHKFRFLSDKVVKRRGLRGWVPVQRNNGDPVRCGDMTLAAMPEEYGNIRNERYRREGEDALRNAQLSLAEGQERAISEARVTGISPLFSSDSIRDADNPSSASLPIGIHSRRG